MENNFIYMTNGKRCPKIHNSEECIAQAIKDGFRKATEEEVKAYLESKKGKKPTTEKNSEVVKETTEKKTTEKKTTKKSTKK